MSEMVELVAEALWQEESRRAAGRSRLVAWSEWADEDRQKWRGLARAAQRNGLQINVY